MAKTENYQETFVKKFNENKKEYTTIALSRFQIMIEADTKVSSWKATTKNKLGKVELQILIDTKIHVKTSTEFIYPTFVGMLVSQVDAKIPNNSQIASKAKTIITAHINVIVDSAFKKHFEKMPPKEITSPEMAKKYFSKVNVLSPASTVKKKKSVGSKKTKDVAKDEDLISVGVATREINTENKDENMGKNVYSSEVNVVEYDIFSSCFPTSKEEFQVFLQKAENLYSQFCPFALKGYLPYGFQFKSNRINSYIVNKKEYIVDNGLPVSKYKNVARWLLEEVYPKGWLMEYELEHKQEAIFKSLKRLNLGKIEINLLNYIIDSKDKSQTYIENHFFTVPQLKKSAISKHLNAMCEMSLDLYGSSSSLLKLEIKDTPDSNKIVSEYVVSSEITKEMLQQIEPREYTAEELNEDMVATHRNIWLLDICKRADSSETAWKVFQIIEKLPPRTISSIVKTPEGENVLRSLKGEDARYAAFSLQSVPKCKELAYEILEQVENAGKVQESQNAEKDVLKMQLKKKENISFGFCDLPSNSKSTVPLRRGQTRISFCD